MGDFEDAFGAGADASEIIDGNSHPPEWNDIKAEWYRAHQKWLAENKDDPKFIARMEEFRAKQDRGDSIAGGLTDDEQDARRRAIETAKRWSAEREAARKKAQR